MAKTNTELRERIVHQEAQLQKKNEEIADLKRQLDEKTQADTNK